MKTQKFFFSLLIALSSSLVMISCGKDTLSDSNGIYVSTPAPVQASGDIVDLGLVEGDLRHMHVSLSDVSVTVIGTLNGNPIESSQFVFQLFTASDGIITDGTYTYSGSGEQTPFTFTAAALSIPNKDSNNFDLFDINGGTLTLTRMDTFYEITIEGSLSSGETFSSSFKGSLNYMDAEITY
jgi:hypothetical protein